MRRHTGHVAVSADGTEAVLEIDEGRLVRVSSTDLTLRLGRMVVRLEMLRADQLRDALEVQARAAPSQPLGATLAARGWISPRDLARCVEAQRVETLARVIVADRGTIVFKRGPVAPLGDQPRISADFMPLEATRHSDEMNGVRALLPAPTAPLVLTAGIDAVVDSPSAAEAMIVAALAGGAGSVREPTERLMGDELAVDELAHDELAIWRAVLTMKERGLLLTGDPLSGRAAHAAVPAAEVRAPRPTLDADLVPFDVGPYRAAEPISPVFAHR